MADKVCSNCHQSYAGNLKTCPHCQHAEMHVISENDIMDISEDDLLELLDDDGVEQAPDDAVALDHPRGGSTNKLPEVMEPDEIDILAVTENQSPEVEPVDDIEKIIDVVEPVAEAPAQPSAPPPIPDVPHVVSPAAESGSAADVPEVAPSEAKKSRPSQPPMIPDSWKQQAVSPEEEKKTKLRKLAAETKLAENPEDLLHDIEEETDESEPLDPKKTKLKKVAKETKLAADPEQLLYDEEEAGEEAEETLDPKKTTLRQKIAPSTHLASQGGAPTKLADTDQPLEIPESEKPSGVDSGDEIVHEVSAVEDDSAVDLGTAAGQAPVPIDIGDESATAFDDSGSIEVGASHLLSDSGSAASVSASDLMDDDEPEAVGVDSLLDDDDAVEVAPTKRKKRAIVVAEGDSSDEAPRGKGKKFRPRYGRRWVGGTMLGIFLTAGAAGAIWYAKPDWIAQALDKHPEYKILTPVQQAHGLIAKGRFQDALNILPAAGGNPEERTARGQAQWLLYLQQQNAKKAPIDPNDRIVKQAIQDVGENSPMADQIRAAAGSQGILQQQQHLQKLHQQVKDYLVKQNILPAGDPRLNQLDSAVMEAVNSKKAADGQVDTLVDILVKAGVAVDRKNLAKTFQAQINELKKDRETITKLAGQLMTPRPMVPEKIAANEKERAALNDLRKQINTALKKAGVAGQDTAGVTNLATARDNLKKQADTLQQVAIAALKELNGGKDVKPGPDLAAQLTKAAKGMRDKTRVPLVHSLVEVVSSMNAMGDAASNWLKDAVKRGAAEAQLRVYEAREPLISSPENNLDTWIAMFKNRSHTGAREMNNAGRDIGWVLSEKAKAGPELKGKAAYLQGLILRNQGKFDPARQNLTAALKTTEGLQDQPPWTKDAAQALKELTDYSAYYLPQVADQFKKGQLQEALQTANRGLTALPKAAPLQALRGLVQLEIAQSQQKIPEAAPQIRQDADAAKVDPAAKAKAHYVLGRLEEALGKNGEAEKHYRQAIASVPKERTDEANIYRIALGRLLLRAQNTRPDADPKHLARGDSGQIQIVAPLGLALLVAFQDKEGDKDLDPQEKKRIERIIAEARVRVKSELDGARGKRLNDLLNFAEENLLKQKELPAELRGQGYMLLGRALSELGKRTDGLKLYLNGMRQFAPNIEVKQLNKLVDSHPAFQLPDVLTQASPARADMHFGQGQHLFWKGRYSEAEQQFQRAIAFFGDDARYHYFLALSLLSQSADPEKTDYHFQQAARLEIQSLPSPEEVNDSLERVQGRLRQTLNEYRRKAALEGAR